MGGPYDKSDVNSNGAPITERQSQNQSQEQSDSDAAIAPQRNPDDEHADIERGTGNGVNEADTGKRRAQPAPLYRHHPPPAQQTSALLRRHI
jgi:hypothetical protein